MRSKGLGIYIRVLLQIIRLVTRGWHGYWLYHIVTSVAVCAEFGKEGVWSRPVAAAVQSDVTGFASCACLTVLHLFLCPNIALCWHRIYNYKYTQIHICCPYTGNKCVQANMFICPLRPYICVVCKKNKTKHTHTHTNFPFTTYNSCNNRRLEE